MLSIPLGTRMQFAPVSIGANQTSTTNEMDYC